MTNEEARKVLEGMGVAPLHKRNKGRAFGSTRTDDDCMHLHGNFTADQLEAIAMWMRDPEGVTSAEQQRI